MTGHKGKTMMTSKDRERLDRARQVLDEAADIVGVTTYELLCQAVDRAGKASTHSPPEKWLEEVQKGS